VHSKDGLDEVSPFAPTRVTQLSGGSISEFEVSPEDFGLPHCEPDAVKGADAKYNARILEEVIGGAQHPSRPAFVLNAAAALVVANELEPKAATAEIEQVIASGKATQLLERWRKATQSRHSD
jgi:anthranilate phosphoribosyltransferase